jgi:hypothetical protein
MGNQQEVLADANEANGLRRRRAFIRGGHFLEIEMIDAKHKRSAEKNGDETSHKGIFALRRVGCKT